MFLRHSEKPVDINEAQLQKLASELFEYFRHCIHNVLKTLVTC